MSKRPPIRIDIDEAATSHFSVRRNPDDHLLGEPEPEAEKTMTMEPRPEFDVWLADPRAKSQIIANSDELFRWVRDRLPADIMEPLVEELDARNNTARHAYLCGKHAKAPPGVPYVIGETEHLGDGLWFTPVWFATSKAALEPE